MEWLNFRLVLAVVSVYLCVRADAKNHGDCDLYKDCVECKAFSTGAFGVMDCIHHCGFATYIPAYDEDFELELKDFPLCQYKNDDNCYFSFKLGKETEFGPNLYVKQELDCPTYDPKHSTDVAVDVTLKEMTSTSTKMPVTIPAEKKGNKMGDDNGNVQSDSAVIEDSQAAAGSDRDSNLISDNEKDPSNSASFTCVSLVIWALNLLIILMC